MGFPTFGTFIEFWSIGSLGGVSKRFNHLLKSAEDNFMYREIHKFIGHCLISLYPWYLFIQPSI